MLPSSSHIFDSFLREECNGAVQQTLRLACSTRLNTIKVATFTFNRFNVLLDFESAYAVIDDEINPDYGEFKLSLKAFLHAIDMQNNTGEALPGIESPHR